MGRVCGALEKKGFSIYNKVTYLNLADFIKEDMIF